MNYTGSPVMVGGGNPMGPSMGQQNPPVNQGPNPVNTILTPNNTPSPGPTGGTNYAYSGQPGQGSGQMASNASSSTMSSK